MEKEVENYCPLCGKQIKQGVDTCPHCKTVLEDNPINRQPLERYPNQETFEYGKNKFAFWIIVGIVIIILAGAAVYFIVNFL